MKAYLISLLVLLGTAGCSTMPITSAQAVAIGGPVVSGGLALVLRNNPSYIVTAQMVGTDLKNANWNDLTLAGVNAVVDASVKKFGGDPTLGAVLKDSFDAGLAAYLEAVGESALAKDPNAIPVLQALGGYIQAGAAIAAANPK